MTTVAELNPCVKAILCPLDNSIRMAIHNIIDAQVLALQAQVVSIEAMLVSLQVWLIPLQALAGLAEMAMDAMLDATSLVPVRLMKNCGDLGVTMKQFSDSLEADTTSAKKRLAELNRSASYAAWLREKVDVLNVQIEQLQGLQLVLGECA